MKRALGHHDGKRRIFFFRGSVMGGLSAIGVVKPERQNAAIEGRDRPDEIHNPDVLRMLHLVECNPGGASEPRKQRGDRQHIYPPRNHRKTLRLTDHRLGLRTFHLLP